MASRRRTRRWGCSTIWSGTASGWRRSPPTRISRASRSGSSQAPRYFGLLALIEANPGLPQGKLADAIHLVRSSLVPIIDKLEIERNSGTPRRRKAIGASKSVWLTAKGQKMLTRLKTSRSWRTRSASPQECRSDDKSLLLRLLQRKMDANLRSTKEHRGGGVDRAQRVNLVEEIRRA